MEITAPSYKEVKTIKRELDEQITTDAIAQRVRWREKYCL
jgi:hypothetical protein